MNAAKYIDILSEHHIPTARRIFGVARPWSLLHDNDRKHVARTVREFLQRERIRVLPWPAKSPDLNIAQNFWARMTSIVHDISPSTVEELKTAIMQAWESIDQEFITNLVDSLPMRLQAVVAADGWRTKY